MVKYLGTKLEMLEKGCTGKLVENLERQHLSVCWPLFEDYF